LFDPQNTLIGGVAYSDKVLATLQIIEGPKGLLGEPVNLTKPTTVIGRHPQRADITFYPDEESSVSRVHCTIQLDGATYKITDNSSTSGTRVNGERLAPNDPRVLHDGDEIVLGDLAKRGIKARFNIISAPGGQKYGATSEDRTIIIGTSHDDDQFRYDDK
jgi:pSer/pThr/pTyr-binding forkhead associated (FHA) protein